MQLLRSSKNRKLQKQASGIDEEREAFRYLRNRWQVEFVAHRFLSPFSEIDLIVQRPDGRRLLVEVKSLSDPAFLDRRITEHQKNRLRRTYLWYLETWPETEFWLIMVLGRGEFLVIEDFLS